MTVFCEPARMSPINSRLPYYGPFVTTFFVDVDLKLYFRDFFYDFYSRDYLESKTKITAQRPKNTQNKLNNANCKNQIAQNKLHKEK